MEIVQRLTRLTRPTEVRHRLSPVRSPQRGGWHHVTVSEHVHRPLDASPATAARALGRLDPLRALDHAISALGLRDVVSLQRARMLTTAGATLGTISAIWPLATDHHARASWTISAEPVAAGQSLLSVAVRVGTEDPADQPQLLEAWPVIGPTVRAQSQRMLASIVELAEDLQEQSAGMA